MTPLERAREVAARVAAGFGLEIFEVSMRREAGGEILRVVLDRPGPAATPEESVSIDDCARVSHELGTILDVEDFLPGAYTLEVSSPGLDRPLVKEADFRRFKGKKAKVRTRTPVEGQSVFRGVILDAGEGQVDLEVEPGRKIGISLAEIEKANLIIDI